MKYILLTELEVSKFNIRTITKTINEDIENLENSIKSSGIIEPLIVRKQKDKFEVVVGQRRFLAAKELKLKEVPCIIKELSDQEALSYSLIENLQRSDVDPMDIAEGLKKMYNYYELTAVTAVNIVKKISEAVGLKERWIWNYLSLTDLTPEVKELVSEGKMTIESGSKLKQKSEEVQETFAEEFSKLLEEAPITQIEEERLMEKIKKAETPEEVKTAIKETKEEMNPQNVTIILNVGSNHAEFKLRKKYYDFLNQYAERQKISPLALLEKIIIEKLKEWGYKVS